MQDEKLRRAKEILGKRWVLHPANRVKRLNEPEQKVVQLPVKQHARKVGTAV